MNIDIRSSATLTILQLYHSIHARGERVEDVVKAEVLEDSFRSGHESPSSAAIKRNIDSQGVSEDGEVEDDPGPEILEGPLSVNVRENYSCLYSMLKRTTGSSDSSAASHTRAGSNEYCSFHAGFIQYLSERYQCM